MTTRGRDQYLANKLPRNCPGCGNPWPLEQNYSLKFCSDCLANGKVPKSKLTDKQRRERIAEENRRLLVEQEKLQNKS